MPQASEPRTEFVAFDGKSLTARDALVEATGIANLLEGSIIAPTYKVSDAMVAATPLTQLGEQVVADTLKNNARLRRNEVHLATFLAVGSPKGLLISDDVNASTLRRTIDTEMKAKRLRFAFIYGRTAHDLVVQRFPEKPTITNRETLTLLDSLPAGVFQHGHTTVGPWGCIPSQARRTISAGTAIYGYQCSDPACVDIHGFTLSSATEPPSQAAIIRAREAVSKTIMQSHASHEDIFGRQMTAAVGAYYYRSPWFASENLLELIADGMSDGELSSILDKALRIHFRSHPGASRDLARTLGCMIGNPTEFAASQERSSALQLLLLMPDRIIIEAVESSLGEAITLKPYEVRISKLRRFDSPGRVELGQAGVRYAGYPAATLMSLLQDVYFGDHNVLDPEDIVFHLSLSGGGSKDSQSLDIGLLQTAMDLHGPRELIQKLILSDRKATERATEYLNVFSVPETKEELLETLLWKLGVPSMLHFNEIDRVRQHCAAVETLGDVAEDDRRPAFTNLFVAVEDLLQSSISYATTALTRDHFSTSTGFLYQQDWTAALDFLDRHAPTTDEALSLRSNGKNTLVPLAAAFGRLSKAISSLNPQDYLRAIEHYPPECWSSPRPFAFKATLPWFDLTADARSRLTSALIRVSSLVSNETVINVRNAASHGNSTPPSTADVRLAIEKIRLCCDELEVTGLFPCVFRREGRQSDEDGRSTYTYKHASLRVSITVPRWAFAPRLPDSGPQLLIMPAAVLQGAGPLRLVLPARQEEDPYWLGWPYRRKPQATFAKAEVAGPSAEDAEAINE